MPKPPNRTADAADVLATTRSRFNIQVTAKDIERAHQNDSYKCVVAQAVARTIKDAHHIEVDTQTIRFSRDHARYVYLTPVAVQGYVIAFDAGDPIEPFKFQLREPIPARRRVRTAKGSAAAKAHGRAKRAVIQRARAAGIPVNSPDVKAEANVAANEAYRAAIEAAPDGPVRESDGSRKAPPQVFKTKHRAYGHRLLRINRKAAASNAGAV